MNAWHVAPAGEIAQRAMFELLAGHEPGAFGPHFTHPASMTHNAEPSALLAVRAAHALAEASRALVIEHALLARGAGESWRDVAGSLGVERDGSPDEHAAYLLLLGARSDDPWWSPATGVLWLCTTCEEAIRDFGPDCGGPDDRESGHAPDCARHRSAVDDWESQWS